MYFRTAGALLTVFMSTSDSGSSLEESSSDDGSSLLARPVFLKKTKKQPQKAASTSKLAISRAEFQSLLDAKEAKSTDFSGVDDTDNLDPEQEYALWKLRELQRRQRDRLRLEQLETEKEELLRRQQGTRVEEEPAIVTEAPKQLGSFYADGVEEKLLKRDYGEVEDLGDHSRPTRYKR